MTIGERIKELRAEANLRQSELRKAIGFSGQVVSNVERGYSFPSTEFVNRSAACFGVPADYILGRTISTLTSHVFPTQTKTRHQSHAVNDGANCLCTLKKR